MKTFFINRLSVLRALVMAFGLGALAAAPTSFAAQGNAATPN